MANTTIRSIKRELRVELLGHNSIDADHVEISNFWFQVVNCKPIQFPFLIARLKKLMVDHFTHEEAIMARVASALCSCHRREHDLLIGFCDRAAKLSEFDWSATQRMLRHEFPRQVHEHIICMDQLLVLSINTYREGAQTNDFRSGDDLR